MDPQHIFCSNSDCPARGQTGKGNVRIHSRKERRYQCTECGQTFAARTGTAFHRLRTAEETVTLVISLLAYGCPVQAIVVAFGFDERTVKKWQTRAGSQCKQVHAHLVEQPRDLGQVQADELWVKLQGLKAWMAMALQVSTRLWLGGVISQHRDMALIVTLVQKIRACALPRPLLVCVDGLASYVSAIRRVFRDPVPTGRRGRPGMRSWRGVYIAQVVKQYARRRVVAVSQRIVQGRRPAIERLLASTQAGGKINTAYIERLNATFRSRLGRLVRRGRALARQIPTVADGMYLVGTVYNFCTFHQSLRLRLRGRPGPTGRRWQLRTPAMAAEITDHYWRVHELLSFPVPPPRWAPPKRRGPVSKATQDLLARWCS